MSDIDRRLAALNPVDGTDLAGAGRSAEGIALLRKTMSEPVSLERAHRSSRRPVALRTAMSAAVVVAVVTAAVVVVGRAPAGGPPTGRGLNMRLVSFQDQDGNIVARIRDPLAASDELSGVFKAHDLNIDVSTVAVSPSLVGSIVYSDVASVTSLHAGTCLTGGGGGCVVGLVIPASFSGEANVTVGRAAEAAEAYSSSADAFGRGEVLHCSGLLGGSTADAESALKETGVVAEWIVDNSSDADAGQAPTGFIVGGIALSSNTVQVDVVTKPLDTPEFHEYVAAANEGC